ncbi:MAG: hypothetical protein AAFV49_08635 [Pseudomonadota bacterium]
MRLIGPFVLAAILSFAPGPAEARDPGAQDAKHACKQAARAQYGARGFDNLTASNRGGGYYKVMGTMMRRGEPNAVMRCRYKNGRITELSIKGEADDAGAALGAALGVAVGAAIIGAVSGDHTHDDYRAPADPPNYGHGAGYSPARNITCYRRQRACYHVNGRLAPNWTEREFGRHAAKQPSGPGVRRRDMQRYCQGEASAKFHQRPGNILTLPVERSRGRFIVPGQFPPRGRRVTTFECRFDANGRFLRVSRS